MNLYRRLSGSVRRERFDTLLTSPGLRIERIVSRGQRTPDGRWLKQARAEWVALIEGRARLRFKGAFRAVQMKRGDCVLIPPGKAHRVEWTDPKRACVWLAVHFSR